jgi:murein DD-endopeptidase MepM/ murein hydrolase activator NlpD
MRTDARQRRRGRGRRWLAILAAGCVAALVVQATVIGPTRTAPYDEGEYLLFPGDWLATTRNAYPQVGAGGFAASAHGVGGSAEGIDPPPLSLASKYYRVRRGDTFTGIAARFGLTLDTIASFNRDAGVGVHQLAIGELVKIPNQDGIYLPVGDDLAQLSLEQGVLPETVLVANGVDLDELTPATELFFPGVQHSGHELAMVTGAAFTRPTAGWVSSRFGPRIDPFTGTRSFHHGVDLAAPHGTAVRATQDGKVAATGHSRVLGKYIIITHYVAGYSSLYGHLHRVYVRRSERVRGGEPIGTVGATGQVTGPHLHFELRRGKIRLDPAQFISGLR